VFLSVYISDVGGDLFTPQNNIVVMFTWKINYSNLIKYLIITEIINVNTTISKFLHNFADF